MHVEMSVGMTATAPDTMKNAVLADISLVPVTLSMKHIKMVTDSKPRKCCWCITFDHDKCKRSVSWYDKEWPCQCDCEREQKIEDYYGR